MEWTYIILVVLIGLVFPLYSMLKGGRSIRELLTNHPEYRRTAYQQSMIFQWIAVTLILGAIALNGDHLSQIGLGFIRNPLWMGGLLAIPLAGVWVVRQLRISDAKLQKLGKRYKEVLYLIPSNEKEYRWAMGLSFTAGICEEIMFRGFLFWQLNQWIPLVPAVLIVNLMFALAHFGTKRRNMVLAFVFGVVASATLIWTGSLWIAMVGHILIDVYSLTRGKQYVERVGE